MLETDAFVSGARYDANATLAKIDTCYYSVIREVWAVPLQTSSEIVFCSLLCLFAGAAIRKKDLFVLSDSVLCG